MSLCNSRKGCLRREDSSRAGSIAAGSLDIMTSMAAAVWPACCLSLLLILLLQLPTPGGIRHQLFQLPRWAEDPQLSQNLPGFRYQMGTAKATHFLEWPAMRVSSLHCSSPELSPPGQCLWSVYGVSQLYGVSRSGKCPVRICVNSAPLETLAQYKALWPSRTPRPQFWLSVIAHASIFLLVVFMMLWASSCWGQANTYKLKYRN